MVSYLGLDGMDLVPLAVAEPELEVWHEHRHYGAPSVVHGEGHRAVDHLQDHEVLSSLDGENDAGGVPN